MRRWSCLVQSVFIYFVVSFLRESNGEIASGQDGPATLLPPVKPPEPDHGPQPFPDEKTHLPVFTMDYPRIQLPFEITLWILLASFAKIGKKRSYWTNALSSLSIPDVCFFILTTGQVAMIHSQLCVKKVWGEVKVSKPASGPLSSIGAAKHWCFWEFVSICATFELQPHFCAVSNVFPQAFMCTTRSPSGSQSHVFWSPSAWSWGASCTQCRRNRRPCWSLMSFSCTCCHPSCWRMGTSCPLDPSFRTRAQWCGTQWWALCGTPWALACRCMPSARFSRLVCRTSTCRRTCCLPR